MGRSCIYDVCPNHPNYDQTRGVCPYCLRDRLCALRSSSFRHNSSNKGCLFPPSSHSSESSSPSNRLSPTSHSHHRHVLDVLNLGSVSFRLGLNGRTANALKSSHSVASLSRNRDGPDAKNGGRKNKKGFWSKLLHLKTNLGKAF